MMNQSFNRWLLAVMALLFASTMAAGTADVSIKINDTTFLPLSQVIGCNLPVINVQTQDSVEPPYEIVYAPAGCLGATSNAPKIPGRLTVYKRIEGLDSVLYDSGDYEKDVSGMTIKVRGNTSAAEAKTPYKIKLQKKCDLLFRGNDSIYKDKEWVLLHDDHLMTSTAFKVSRIVGMPWTPGHGYVNLIINGKYRGIYLLCEAVKRNPRCRLDVDKATGFVFENDAYWWNENVYVQSNTAPKYNYTFKYPDEDDITQEQLDYMQRLVNEFEASLTADNYPELIDVHSFAAWCLVHDITGTKDGGGANRFYTKYDSLPESKIVMPLVWDFDLAERSGNAWSRCHSRFMDQLFANSNRAYVSEFVRIWCSIRETFISDINAAMNGFLNSPEGQAMQSSYALNNAAYGANRYFANHISGRKQWFSSHYAWLDRNILALRVVNDVNFDGVVDVEDVTCLIGGVLGINEVLKVSADMNNDGKIDIEDVIRLVSAILGD